MGRFIRLDPHLYFRNYSIPKSTVLNYNKTNIQAWWIETRIHKNGFTLGPFEPINCRQKMTSQPKGWGSVMREFSNKSVTTGRGSENIKICVTPFIDNPFIN